MAAMSRSRERRPDLQELPDYRVRVSKRARRMQLQVSTRGEVEVVVPRGCSPASARAFVAGHRVWLHRTLARLQRQSGLRPELDTGLPERILLPAIDASWRAVYREGARSGVRERRADAEQGRLLVTSPDEERARAALREWLRRTARTHLLPWLTDLSERFGLPFSKVSVRGQKTRWGSCTAEGHISLNRNLLFLPRDVVRYLLVHELCHTVHLNHSRRYWARVARIEPDYRELDAQLRDADRFVPLWADPD